MDIPPFLPHIQARILDYERRGLVLRTFRRLDPQRQAAVIAAILAEANEKGPPNLNIKSVAARAGVSIGSLYQYFGSRDGLLAFSNVLVVDSIIDLFARARPSLAAMPLGRALEAYLADGVEMNRTQAGTLQYFARAAYGGPSELTGAVVRPLADEMLASIRAMLAAAQARGELRPRLDLEAAARLLHALTLVIGDAQRLPDLNAYFQVIDVSMPPERLVAALVDLLQHGLGAPVPAQEPKEKKKSSAKKNKKHDPGKRA